MSRLRLGSKNKDERNKQTSPAKHKGRQPAIWRAAIPSQAFGVYLNEMRLSRIEHMFHHIQICGKMAHTTY